MKLRFGSVLGALALLAVALPVWARSLSVTVHLTSPATIAGQQLKPGHYRFVAGTKDTGVKVYRDNQLVATVPGHWVDKSGKSPASAVVFENGRIIELEFAGKTQAVELP